MESGAILVMLLRHIDDITNYDVVILIAKHVYGRTSDMDRLRYCANIERIVNGRHRYGYHEET